MEYKFDLSVQNNKRDISEKNTKLDSASNSNQSQSEVVNEELDYNIGEKYKHDYCDYYDHYF